MANACSRMSQPTGCFGHMIGAYDTNEDVFEAFGAFAQFGYDAVHHDSSLMNDGNAFAEAFHHFEDVRCEKDGGALANLVDQDIFHEPGAHSVDSFKGLVHEKELGPMDEGRGHGDA